MIVIQGLQNSTVMSYDDPKLLKIDDLKLPFGFLPSISV